MADITDDIRAALETKLVSVSGLPEIAFDNIPFDPVTGTSFIRSRFMPVNRRPAVRGLNPQQLYTGTYMVTVFSPEGKGSGAANALAKLITEAFEATTSISYTNPSDETITVSIDYSEIKQGLLDTPWYSVPVVIGWYIYK